MEREKNIISHKIIKQKSRIIKNSLGRPENPKALLKGMSSFYSEVGFIKYMNEESEGSTQLW